MANIGLVHDNPTPSAADNATKTLLEGAGHTVTLINETASPPSGYDLIIISESGSASAVAPYDNYAGAVMVWETAWDALRLSSAGASSSASTTSIDLQGHASTAGLPDPLTYLTSNSSLYGVATSSLPSGVDVVAVNPSATSHAFCVVADTGATLTSGTATARRCGMGMVSTRMSNLTADGEDFVLAVVDWLVGGGGSPAQGTASGTYSFSGSASGARNPQGSASGTFTFAGSASGSRPSSGTVSGTYDFTGTAVGNAPANSGTASGTYSFSGSATGAKLPQGSATGTFSFAGSAAGERISQGAVSGGYDYTGTATGSGRGGGQIEGAWHFSGSAQGSRPSQGAVLGTYHYEGVAVGEGLDPTFSFEPPTYRRMVNPPVLTRRTPVPLQESISIVRVGGVLTQVKTPSHAQLTAAGAEGEDYFIGGHVYSGVPLAVANELIAAGYTVTEE